MLHLRHLGSALFHLLVLDNIKLFLLKNMHCTKEMLTSQLAVTVVMCFARTLLQVIFMVCSARQRNGEKEGMKHEGGKR